MLQHAWNIKNFKRNKLGTRDEYYMIPHRNENRIVVTRDSLGAMKKDLKGLESWVTEWAPWYKNLRKSNY